MSHSSTSLARPAVGLILWSALSGCADRPAPVGPVPASESAVIVDAVHNGGTAQFYFLPPLVPQPTFAGQSDPALSPFVQVCVMNGGDCEYAVAEFTATAGTGSAVVGYHAGSAYYHVNWDTDRCAWGPCELDPNAAYRLRVFVNGLLLGYADLAIVPNAGAARNLNTEEVIPLVDGRMLPVRFRIETGIAASLAITPDPASVDVGATVQLTATVRDLHGNVIPGATVDWSIDALVATVSATGVLSGVTPGCTLVRATHDWLSATAGVRVTPLDPEFAYYYNAPGVGYRIFGLRADGCIAPVQLSQVPVHSPQFDRPVAISRDGQYLAFQGADDALHVSRIDGTDDRIVPTGGQVPWSLSWSPDASELAFTGYVGSGHSEVFAVGVDGSNLRRVSVTTLPPVTGGSGYSQYSSTVMHIRWSPADNTISYTRHVHNQVVNTVRDSVYVHVVRSDGTSPVTLASAAGGPHMLTPEWAPDGSRIAYIRADDNSLWTVNPDGTGATQLVGPLNNQRSGVSWSPDGQEIAYTDNAVPGSGLFVVSASGGSPTLLASPVYPAAAPAWVDGGLQVIYAHVTGAGGFLYAAARDGSGTRSLGPGWAPVRIP